MSDLLLGIDLGTSSVKAAAIDYNGYEVCSAACDYNISVPEAGYAEQDMEKLWQAACATIRGLLEKNNIPRNAVTGIGLSGQMHGLVMLDSENRLLYNAIIWADQRSTSEIKEIYTQIPQNEFQDITLNTISPGILASSLLWIKNNKPDIYRKIRTILLPKDYIRYKLCNALGTEATDASGTLLFDVKKRNWSWKIIDSLGMDRRIFPACSDTCSIAGYTTAEAAEQTMLPQGIPVAYGGGDQSMQMLGNGIINSNNWVLNIGTASQIACSVDEPLHEKTFRTNTFCHAGSKKWLVMGASLSGGIALKWLRKNILTQYTYAQFDDLALQTEPGSNGLLFLPSLSGERAPHNNPQSRGCFFGLTLDHTYRHMIRSVMEGIVFNLRESAGLLESTGIPVPPHFISSGGGARSSIWLQIQADIFNKDIYTSTSKEQACLGAAVTAAIATGLYGSIDATCAQMVRINDTVTHPVAQNVQIYAGMFRRYKELYARLYEQKN
jgi:xylulokinase